MIKYETVSLEMLSVSPLNDDTASSSSDTVSYTYESDSEQLIHRTNEKRSEILISFFHFF